jgi:hypothetical protein
MRLNDAQIIFNNFKYTYNDIAQCGNCFFKAAALSLGFLESMHSLLRSKTVSYIRNNLDYFYGFDTNIDIEIEDISQEGGWENNLSIQAFADAFGVNIVLFNAYGNNLATITPKNSKLDGTTYLLYTASQDRTIHLLYSQSHYIPISYHVINNNSNYLNQDQVGGACIDGFTQEEQLVSVRDKFDIRTIVDSSNIRIDFRTFFEEESKIFQLFEERLAEITNSNEMMLTLQSGEEHNVNVANSVPESVILHLGKVMNNNKLAADLISQYGQGLFDMEQKDLRKLDGIGKKRAQYIKEVGEQYQKIKINSQLESKDSDTSIDLTINTIFAIKYDNLILNHPQLPLILKIAKEKGGATLLMELMSFKGHKEFRCLSAEEIVDQIIEQNFFLNNKRGREFIQYIENHFDKDILLKTLELGRDQEIAEQILTESEIQSINEIIAILLGEELQISSASSSLENVLGQDELTQLRIVPNGILNICSNKACQKIANYVDNLAKILDDMLNMEKTGNKITITIALLEEWLGFAASGQRFADVIPSYYDPNDDDWPSSSGGNYEGNVNNGLESTSDELTDLILPLYNETDHQMW